MEEVDGGSFGMSTSMAESRAGAGHQGGGAGTATVPYTAGGVGFRGTGSSAGIGSPAFGASSSHANYPAHYPASYPANYAHGSPARAGASTSRMRSASAGAHRARLATPMGQQQY